MVTVNPMDMVITVTLGRVVMGLEVKVMRDDILSWYVCTGVVEMPKGSGIDGQT